MQTHAGVMSITSLAFHSQVELQGVAQLEERVFIHPVNGCSGCSQFGAITNDAAMSV